MLLVDDDCRREIRENVDVRLTVARQKILHERRERLIEQTLGFRGDRVEHQRALPAARDAGEHGDLSTGNVERDVLEIVLACAAHFDVAERRAH
jgi:hypothetical protein